jgi:hypothetical protein
VWRDLMTDGLSCGLHRIERLMRLQALKARPRRCRLPPDLGERQVSAVAANVLDRSFEAPAPNRKWIADFTYVWTAEGWLYVAAVIDLFSRRVVGWSMSAGMTPQLVTDALVMAIWRRGKPNALLHHSDRGSQSEFKWSSQRLERACDEEVETTIGPFWSGGLTVTGATDSCESRTDEEVLGSNFCRFGERRGCGDRGRTTSGRGTVVQKGRWHATSDVRAVCTAAFRQIFVTS